jgi:HlyD family secretion protein
MSETSGLQRGINVGSVKWKRWLLRGLILAVVLGGAAFGALWWHPWSSGSGDVTFSTVTVNKGAIAAQVTANGTLSARKTVQVGAQVTGRVVFLGKDFNDEVKEGDVLARLDTTLFKAAVDNATANVEQAYANVKKAEVSAMDTKRQYERNKKLREQQLIADFTLEQAEVAYKSAVANLQSMQAQAEQNRAQLVQAKANLEYCTIKSPINGIVLTRSYDLGQTVQSSFSAPTLFTIAEDLSRMQIDTSVAEGDVGRLKDGMDATFSVDAFPGRTFKGTVRQVRNSPTTTQGVVTYDAVIDVDNSSHELRPGMTANCTFVLAQVADTIKIPNAAMRFKPSRDQLMALAEHFGMGNRMRGSGAGSSGRPPGMDGMTGASGGGAKPKGENADKKPLWKLVDGKPHRVMVKTGLTDGSSTQLVEGDLQPGDQLITEIQGLSAPTRKMGAF